MSIWKGFIDKIYSLCLLIYDLCEITEEHLHSDALLYPLLANPVTLTKATGVWADFPAVKTEIIPVNTVGAEFDIHFVFGSSLSANGNYVVALYKGLAGAEINVGYAPMVRTAIGGTEGAIVIPCKKFPANTRISAALSSSNNAQDTLAIKLQYHTY